VKVVGGEGAEGTWGRSDGSYCQLNAIHTHTHTTACENKVAAYLKAPDFTFTTSIHRTAQYIKKVDPQLLNKGLKLKQ